MDSSRRILLFRTADARIDAPSLWLTPGGGLESDEDYHAAALRELTEETGLVGALLSPCVWIRRHVWRWGEEWIESVEHFFVVQAPDGFEVSTGAFTDDERVIVKEYRWWALEEIVSAADEVFVPRRMAELLLPLVGGDLPRDPIDPGI